MYQNITLYSINMHNYVCIKILKKNFKGSEPYVAHKALNTLWPFTEKSLQSLVYSSFSIVALLLFSPISGNSPLSLLGKLPLQPAPLVPDTRDYLIPTNSEQLTGITKLILQRPASSLNVFGDIELFFRICIKQKA